MEQKIWRVELGRPFTGGDVMWTEFVRALNEEAFYDIEENGPDERFFITTQWDASMSEVDDIVERVLCKVLGIDRKHRVVCQTCNGEGVIPIPDIVMQTELCDDCIMKDKCPACGAAMIFEEDGYGKCTAGHAWGG